MKPELSAQYKSLLEKACELTKEILGFSASDRAEAMSILPPKELNRGQQHLSSLLAEVENLIDEMSAVSKGPVQITLSRSYSIAQFFAFKFVHLPRLELSQLQRSPFAGSGIYAIYYTGAAFPAYLPISKTETPIYVGKASPKDSYAETTSEQGTALFDRLVEHAKNINRGDLLLSDFQYRCATVQSGLQDTVEGFMIKLFQPLWNKEVKVAYGIGKHGDSATTRANKRSPWDTLHPGRKWATATAADQVKKDEILAKIAQHLTTNPPFNNRDILLKRLAEQG